MMEGRLIHWCALETGEATSGEPDAYGQFATVVTTASASSASVSKYHVVKVVGR